MPSLLIFLFLAFTTAHAKGSHCQVSDSLNQKARQFMIRNSLVKPGEEMQTPQVSFRWTLTRAELIQNKCALVMDMCAYSDSDTICEGLAYEVLGYRTNGKVTLFERFFPPPHPLRVGIGNNPDSNYYVELKGTSAISAWKTILLKLPYTGLMAKISAKNVQTINNSLYGEPDGKVFFDPTPGRTWKLKNPTWSLRRGSTIEILDVYSYQLDEDFLAYFSGSGGAVGPWTSLIYRYYDRRTRKWKPTGITASNAQ